MSHVIDIKGISKKYRIQSPQQYHSLRDAIYGGVKNIFAGNKGKEDFWALKDIDLQVEAGERIGIIGRNGAGKSTLLKIISRITPPTKGQIILEGRVASLLEVGTGFHGELTGRENIYFNGSILGLKKVEIDSRLEEIISFSGIEKFIDTPLKHYSSGMQLRLAFSVAAHLEPEVLLIDEVLAVGDLEFQKKCLAKMEEVSRRDGRTILFVSHNMNYISSFCTKGVFLEKGEIRYQGDLAGTIQQYSQISEVEKNAYVKVSNKEFVFNGIMDEDRLRELEVNDDIDVRLSFSTRDFQSQHLFFDIGIYNSEDQMVVHSRTRYNGRPFSVRPGQDMVLEYRVESPNLAPGNYTLTIFVYEEVLEQKVLYWVDRYPFCYVNSKNPYSAGEGIDHLQDIKSVTYPKSSFRLL